MASVTAEEVLGFWFPAGIARDDAAAHHERLTWWFRGGADSEVMQRFVPTLEAARRGELDGWAQTPRGRLALILVLDQFSRTVYRDTADAFAQDEKARALALEGFAKGDYDKIEPVWEKTFFILPLGHSEDIKLQDRAVAMAAALVDAAPEHLRKLYEVSLAQARAHRDVIKRFGRHPHRNQVLGRESTAEEREYLVKGDLPHKRTIPG